MLVADTNILVRVITNDDAVESSLARELVTANDVFVGATVLLECAWVLGSRYQMSTRRIAEVLRSFVGLPRVSVEAPDEVDRALGWTQEGADVADAFHLACNGARGPFATFDRDLIRFARTRNIPAVEP